MLIKTWFFLWGLLWAIYFMLDGFDLGAGMLMPFLSKDEKEKRAIANAVGPVWNGNEVWLITAGGVTFAAFPTTYAVMFSSLYAPLLLVLFALIIRGVSFEYRALSERKSAKSFWTNCLFIGSAAPALLLGVAFANLFKGIPLEYIAKDSSWIYHGNFITLLNPYGLAGGVLFVLMFIMHGALWIALKTEGPVQQRASSLASKLWPALLVVAAGFLVFSWFATTLYANYLKHPYLFVLPIAAVAGLVAMRLFISKSGWMNAWFSSSVFILSATLFGVVGMFPSTLISSLDKAWSVTAYNSASSPLTLKIMLGVALVFVPVVIIYQAWTYNLFKGKSGDEDHSY